MQYLFSVIDDGTGLAGPTEEADIDAFNDAASGRWSLVLRRRPRGADPATVIYNRGDEVVFSDGPFLESKEYLAGFWIIEAPDLDVASSRRRGLEGLQSETRGAAVPVVSAIDVREAITRAHHEEWARWSPPWTRRSATSISPRKRRPKRSRPPSGGGRPTAYRPTPAPG